MSGRSHLAPSPNTNSKQGALVSLCGEWKEMTLSWLFHSQPRKSLSTTEIYFKSWLNAFAPDYPKPTNLHAWIKRAHENDPEALRFIESLIDNALAKYESSAKSDSNELKPPWAFDAADAQKFIDRLVELQRKR